MYRGHLAQHAGNLEQRSSRSMLRGLAGTNYRIGAAGLPALMDRGQQRGEMWKSRIPFPIQDALNQLYTVTERRGHHEYRLDDDDTECPICLSSFSRRSNDMSSRRDTEIDLEAGLETHETAKTITVDASKRNKTPLGTYWVGESRSRLACAPQPGDTVMRRTEAPGCEVVLGWARAEILIVEELLQVGRRDSEQASKQACYVWPAGYWDDLARGCQLPAASDLSKYVVMPGTREKIVHFD
ncbi:hypothetical protein CHU98_g7343 [Xylaria longipes]|nr:hypothetical protein CHU98_g7343 [Xylaria longipes]